MEAGLLRPDPEHHARPEDPGSGKEKNKVLLSVLFFSYHAIHCKKSLSNIPSLTKLSLSGKNI
ncbi:MAG: hypothetical protein ACK55I_39355, partial [bacterium]